MLTETAEDVEITERRKRKKKNMDPGFSGLIFYVLDWFTIAILLYFEYIHFEYIMLCPFIHNFLSKKLVSI